MGYGLNITHVAEQIAEQAIPKKKTAYKAHIDEAARHTISAAISVTLREIMSDRAKLNQLLKLADHPIDEGRAGAFHGLSYKDQCSVLHRIGIGMRRIMPIETESQKEQTHAKAS